MPDTFGASRKFRLLAVNDDCGPENLCRMANYGVDWHYIALGKPTTGPYTNLEELWAPKSASKFMLV